MDEFIGFQIHFLVKSLVVLAFKTKNSLLVRQYYEDCLCASG
jgi:hypothetical protein